MSHFPPIVFAIAFAALVVALTALARRLPIPTPILQVLAGAAIGLLPGMHLPELEPDLVFFVFLPPILWAAAFFTSLREFRANIRPIGLLAVGLVLATTAAVAMAAHALLPGLPWAVAVAIGAIVSPPDAVAAAAIVSRLPVPRRVVAWAALLLDCKYHEQVKRLLAKFRLSIQEARTALTLITNHGRINRPFENTAALKRFLRLPSHTEQMEPAQSTEQQPQQQ